MSELAFNKHGQRIRLPENAARWGIRRLCENRTSRVVYERGVPMTVPITVNIDELREALHRVLGDERGRYRLTALDEMLAPLPNVPAAYVSLPPSNDPFGDEDVEAAATCAELVRPTVVAPVTVAVAEPGAWSALPMPTSMNGSEYLLAEAWRGHVQMQVELMRHLTSTLTATLAAQTTAANAATSGASQMMTAAAELLRAADGAAMPRRQPSPEAPAAPVAPIVIAAPAAEPRNAAAPIEDGTDMDDLDEDPIDDDEEVVADGGDGVVDKIQKAVINVLGTAAPMLPHIATIMHGHAPGPNASGTTAPGPRNASTPTEDVEDDGGDDDASGFSPAVGSHLRLVHQELGADGALFRALYQNLEPDARRALVERLCGLGLEDAVDAALDLIAPLKARMARRSTPKQPTVSVAEPAPMSDAVPDRESTDDAPSECRETGVTANALTSEQQAHVLEIAKHLTMAEVIRVQVLIASLAADERTAWIERLATVPAAEAAQIVKAELARRA